MQAEIITIGDELLIGQVVDTNSAWLGSTLGDDGIKVIQITSVQDHAAQIVQAVNDALSRADIVLMTGGLGPTKDDITKKTLAEMFGMKLVRNEQVYEMVGKQLALRGIAFTELNQGQALVPDGCTVLPNRNGTAPGMWFERDGKVLISMPGVPFEMKALVKDEVLPRLRKHFALDANVHRTIITFGLAESILADTIASWEEALPPYLHLAYLPSALCIRLRLSAYEIDRQKAEQEIESQIEKLSKVIPQYIIGSEDDFGISNRNSVEDSWRDPCHRRILHRRQYSPSVYGNAGSLGIFQRWCRSLFKRSQNSPARCGSRESESLWGCQSKRR